MLEIPRLTLYNKADKVADFTPTQTPYRLVSAKDPDSRTKLQDILLEKMQELFQPFTIQVPFDQAYRIHELETIAILAERSYEETGEVITGYITPKNAWILEEFYHRGLS